MAHLLHLLRDVCFPLRHEPCAESASLKILLGIQNVTVDKVGSVQPSIISVAKVNIPIANCFFERWYNESYIIVPQQQFVEPIPILFPSLFSLFEDSVIGDSECGDEYDFVEHSDVRQRVILFQLNHIAAEDCEDIVLYFIIVLLQLSFTLKDAQSRKFLLQWFSVCIIKLIEVLRQNWVCGFDAFLNIL